MKCELNCNCSITGSIKKKTRVSVNLPINWESKTTKPIVLRLNKSQSKGIALIKILRIAKWNVIKIGHKGHFIFMFYMNYWLINQRKIQSRHFGSLVTGNMLVIFFFDFFTLRMTSRGATHSNCILHANRSVRIFC